jgi:guanylate kinase
MPASTPSTDRSLPSRGDGTRHITGRLFIISAPSGAGKSTLCRAVRQRLPDLHYSVSHTTRSPRGGEKNGVDYYFVTETAFRKGIDTDKWAEWAMVHGNYYGTSAEFIDRTLGQGCDVLLDIDVQGMEQILRRYPDSVTIFIMPPSRAVLRQRLQQRGTDTAASISERLDNAAEEIKRSQRYRHIVVNDRLEEAVEKLTAIIAAGRSRRFSEAGANLDGRK